MESKCWEDTEGEGEGESGGKGGDHERDKKRKGVRTCLFLFPFTLLEDVKL
jgi:hypothetical protein